MQGRKETFPPPRTRRPSPADETTPIARDGSRQFRAETLRSGCHPDKDGYPAPNALKPDATRDDLRLAGRVMAALARRRPRLWLAELRRVPHRVQGGGARA